MVLFDNLIINNLPVRYFGPVKEFWKSTFRFMVGVFLNVLLQMPSVPQASGFVLHVGKTE